MYWFDPRSRSLEFIKSKSLLRWMSNVFRLKPIVYVFMMLLCGVSTMLELNVNRCLVTMNV